MGCLFIEHWFCKVCAFLHVFACFCITPPCKDYRAYGRLRKVAEGYRSLQSPSDQNLVPSSLCDPPSYFLPSFYRFAVNKIGENLCNSCHAEVPQIANQKSKIENHFTPSRRAEPEELFGSIDVRRDGNLQSSIHGRDVGEDVEPIGQVGRGLNYPRLVRGSGGIQDEGGSDTARKLPGGEIGGGQIGVNGSDHGITRGHGKEGGHGRCITNSRAVPLGE
jgi:hypothetical protein